MAGDIANVVESEEKQEKLLNIDLENLKKKKALSSRGTAEQMFANIQSVKL